VENQVRDPERLDQYLRGALKLDGPMQLEPIAGGQSNPTYFVTYPGRRLVLRKQPDGPVLPSAHAVDREFRVLDALSRTDVPVPKVLLFYAERDVAGTPFYVMERLDGRVFHDNAMTGAAPDQRRAMYLSAAATLGMLHEVDWARVGLEGFGRPGNYFSRQIARWTRQWEAARFREIPSLSELAEWLPAHLPPEDDLATIVHGDYRIGNLMFHPTRPHVVGVLDWELSTLGHPMADLAHSCIAWRSSPEEYGGLLGLDLPALGIPTEAEYVAAYFARRRDPGEGLTPFHMAFACFRFAVIFEGIAARARAGTAAGADAAKVGELSLAFAHRGLEAIG